MPTVSESARGLACEQSAWDPLKRSREKPAEEVRGVSTGVTRLSLVAGKVRNAFFKVASPSAVPLIKNPGVGSLLPSCPHPRLYHPMCRDPFFQVRDKKLT